MSNTIISRFSKITTVSALAVTLAVSVPGWAEAFGFVEKFGMVGLTRGQTARLNVVNVGNPNESACSVELSFLDQAGNVVGFIPCIVPPGQADFLDLSAEALGGPDTFGRFQIRATVALRMPVLNLLAVQACQRNLRITLEVFDNATGTTTVFVGNPND